MFQGDGSNVVMTAAPMGLILSDTKPVDKWYDGEIGKLIGDAHTAFVNEITNIGYNVKECVVQFELTNSQETATDLILIAHNHMGGNSLFRTRRTNYSNIGDCVVIFPCKRCRVFCILHENTACSKIKLCHKCIRNISADE